MATRTSRARIIVWLFCALYILSLLFVVVASLINISQHPAWMGIADVLVAFLLVGVMIALAVLTQGKVNPRAEHSSYRVYRWLGVVPLILLALFFLTGEAINWTTLLPGLAWRVFVLSYSLPFELINSSAAA